MSNICAGIGRGQMLVLEEFIARRRAIHEHYKQLLSGIDGVRVMDSPSAKYQSNFWLTCLQVDPEVAGFTPEELRLQLETENIESHPLWKPMHLQPVFAKAPFYGNGTSKQLFRNGLCLPSSPVLTDGDVERVAEAILAFSDRVQVELTDCLPSKAGQAAASGCSQ